jgi:hypothetical protein
MRALLLIILFAGFLGLDAVNQDTYPRYIKWKGIDKISVSENDTLYRAAFAGATYSNLSAGLPEYRESFAVTEGISEFSVTLENLVYDIAPEEYMKVGGMENIRDEVQISSVLGFDRKKPYITTTILPFRINPYNNVYEILLSFDLVIITSSENRSLTPGSRDYVPNSVLANGAWYKIAVTESGVHKISYSDLQAMGLDPSSFDPRDFRLYGNGGGMLPESLAEPRHDDLKENSIIVIGENDGTFDQQDYVLFFGESPHTWYYQSINQAFHHHQNIYSDSTY